MTDANGFDKLARVYRVMEYASFGPLLWRVRAQFLPEMRQARRALVLGDGDGRFTAALMRSNPAVQVTAVDASRAMLDLLRGRVAVQGAGARLQTVHADAAGTLPEGEFDLVCTHFLLDCLSDEQVSALAFACAARMRDGGCWAISEFAVPPGWMRVPAWLLVQALYLAFRGLTGLQVSRLPDYAAALQQAGLVRAQVRCRLFGVLRSEWWQWSQGASDASEPGMSTQQKFSLQNEDPQIEPSPTRTGDDQIVPEPYPPSGEDVVLPSLPSDPLPNPEPEQPSLGMPDPGIYEGTGGPASLDLSR